MKRLFAFLFFCATLIPQSHADMRMGSGLTANDIATHMGILTWSYSFLSPKPFHKLEVKLNYYEKKGDGFESKMLIGYIQLPVKAETRTAIKIFIDADKSTIIHSDGAVTGEGMTYDKTSATIYSNQPPEPTKDGRYIIWQCAPKGTNFMHGVLNDKTTSYLELDIKPTF